MKCEIVGRCVEEYAAHGRFPGHSRYDYHLKLNEPADDFLFEVGEFVTVERTPSSEDSASNSGGVAGSEAPPTSASTQALCQSLCGVVSAARHLAGVDWDHVTRCVNESIAGQRASGA
jgi:hypothetical protein